MNAGRPSLTPRLTNAIATSMRVTELIAQRAAAAGQEGRDEVCAQAYEQAARVAARIAAFYCGAASYMAKRAPQPGGPRYEQTVRHNSLQAGGYIANAHNFSFKLGELIAEMEKFKHEAEKIGKIGGKFGDAGVVLAGIDAYGYINEYYKAHPELDRLRRENNAAAQFELRWAINVGGVVPSVQDALVRAIYEPDATTGRSRADEWYDFRWKYLGGKYGW